MKKTIKLLMMLMLIIGISATTKVFAQDQDHWKGKKERMEARVQEIFAQLNLTEEQKQLLDANKSKHGAAREDGFKHGRDNMKAIGEELKKKDYDVAKIRAIHEESKKLRNEMADKRLEGILEVRKILTDEQFVKFTQLMEKDRQKNEKHEVEASK